MNILVTGAKGFIGRNLVSQLHNIQSGKARNYPVLGTELKVFEYDMDSDPAELDVYCKKADFVFNLAGVNRPKDQSEFMKGNFGFASLLLDTLKKHGNACPVMIHRLRRLRWIIRMASRSGRERTFCSSMPERLGRRSWSIVFRTCSGNGAVRTITVRWRLSVTISRTTCLSR